MKRALSSLIIAASFATTVWAGGLDVNVDANDVALHGFDPVAYFVDSQPELGKPEYTAVYQGAVFRFASAEHRDAFKSNPQNYAPQFGGFCAFGTSISKKFDGDPQAWAIRDHKLYVNVTPDTHKLWLKEADDRIKAANTNWPKIKDVDASKLNADK